MLHYLFYETKDQLKTISLRGMVLTHDHENQIKIVLLIIKKAIQCGKLKM
jgi:hypothetical protein